MKQGLKYDDPASASFNEFFYRKQKLEARPVEELDNSHRIVSAADCCLMALESVSEATRLWIKVREFTIPRLVGDTYEGQVKLYNGGAVASSGSLLKTIAGIGKNL
ncbi:hypothetical protein HWV62_1767 [Athelia sp. TMB]|nr:hypothetical protein HWV62_1767 [Athelia sp. TMB]